MMAEQLTTLTNQQHATRAPSVGTLTNHLCRQVQEADTHRVHDARVFQTATRRKGPTPPLPVAKRFSDFWILYDTWKCCVTAPLD